MEQSEMAASQGPEAPRGSIVVLGKQNDYLIIAPTVEQAVEDTRLYLSTNIGYDRDGGDPKKCPPSLGDLDFFDAAGQRLEPVVLAGQLESLAVKNYQDEIRNRIWIVYYMNRGKAREENPNGPEVTPPPNDTISFEEFIRILVSENQRLKDGDPQDDEPPQDDELQARCDLFRHWWGHC